MDAAQEPEFISIGVITSSLGISVATARNYEKLGVIPTGRRVGGSGARIWPAEELQLMRQRVAERRAARREGLTTMG